MMMMMICSFGSLTHDDESSDRSNQHTLRALPRRLWISGSAPGSPTGIFDENYVMITCNDQIKLKDNQTKRVGSVSN